MKNFRAADKSHAGGDEKHDINFHWPNHILFYKGSIGYTSPSKNILVHNCQACSSDKELWTKIENTDVPCIILLEEKVTA